MAMIASFEIDEGMVTSIAGVLEPPFPLLRSAKGLAGYLPIEKVGLFLFATVRLDANILVLLANTLYFAQCLIQIVAMKVM